MPLRPADPDLRADLQEVLHLAHDGPGYQRFLHDGEPEPPLRADDADWAAHLVPKAA